MIRYQRATAAVLFVAGGTALACSSFSGSDIANNGAADADSGGADTVVASGVVPLAPQKLLSPPSLGGLAVSDRVYWSEPSTGKIRSVNLDATGAVDVIKSRTGPGTLTIDGGFMYWLEPDASLVAACKLPECMQVVELAHVQKPRLLAVGDRVYFASEQDSSIHAAQLPH